MNKRTSFHIWHVLLASILVCVLAGCAIVTPTATPALQSPAPASPYIHYTPPETSNVHLEFDYPSSWVFSEEKIQGTNIISVGLVDPRLLSVPTRAPNEPHGIPSDFGRISIWIQPLETNQTLDTRVEAHKQGHNDVSWIKALNDYQIMIDGHNARVLEYQITPFDGNGYTSLMFERDIFFTINDQIYQLVFIVAEEERGDEFEKGYEYFFNSIKIVP